MLLVVVCSFLLPNHLCKYMTGLQCQTSPQYSAEIVSIVSKSYVDASADILIDTTGLFCNLQLGVLRSLLFKGPGLLDLSPPELPSFTLKQCSLLMLVLSAGAPPPQEILSKACQTVFSSWDPASGCKTLQKTEQVQ